MRSVARFCRVVLGGALLATAVHGQAPIDVERPLRPDASVKVWNGGGVVRVEGGRGESVSVVGRVLPGPGEFFLVGDDRAVKLGLQTSFGSGAAELEIRVPSTATVWVRTAGADVVIRGLTGAVDIHTVSGSIDVEGELDHLWAESMGGEVSLSVGAQVVRAKTGSGGLTLRGAVEHLELSTVDGGMRVQTPAPAIARLSTVDGDLCYRGGLRPGGSLSVESHRGDVSLGLAAGVEAAFDLYSFGGEISDGPRRSAGGTAPSAVRVETFTGDIVVAALDSLAECAPPEASGTAPKAPPG